MSDYSLSVKHCVEEYTVETLHEWSMIDKFFLRKFENIIKYEDIVVANPFDQETLYEAKRMGFSDVAIAKLLEYKRN